MTQLVFVSFRVHSATTEQVQQLAKIFFFPRASQLLSTVKRSHVFKFCECLKASSTMTRFGSMSSNSCYFTPKQHQKQSQKVRNQKFFLGACPQTPLAGALSCALLHFTMCSDQSSAHWNPPFQNPRSTTDFSREIDVVHLLFIHHLKWNISYANIRLPYICRQVHTHAS